MAALEESEKRELALRHRTCRHRGVAEYESIGF